MNRRVLLRTGLTSVIAPLSFAHETQAQSVELDPVSAHLVVNGVRMSRLDWVTGSLNQLKPLVTDDGVWPIDVAESLRSGWVTYERQIIPWSEVGG